MEYPKYMTVEVDRIFLDQTNPRHKPFRGQADVIEYLCGNEDVLALARDIVKHGLNPIEQFALLPDKGSGKNQTFIVAEGNRRMCAVKLLYDPELAPANLRKEFRDLSKKAPDLAEVRAVLFKDRPSVHVWLERIHGGVQGGVGRKPWNSEQKTRHIGDRKNIVAQAILDYAEQSGFLPAEQRRGKLTTAQRYLGNKRFRDAIGIDSADGEDISRNRPQAEFDAMVKRFIGDLADGTANSRADARKIEDYARDLEQTPGVTTTRVQPEPLRVSGSKRKKGPSRGKSTSPKHLEWSSDIDKLLSLIPGIKLRSLYNSLTAIEIESSKHVPLLSVGAWAFFESMSAKAGRSDGTSFESFFSKSRLSTFGIDASDIKSMMQAIARISSYGNTTKHHEVAANFNGHQLYNDMVTLSPLILQVLKSVTATKI